MKKIPMILISSFDESVQNFSYNFQIGRTSPSAAKCPKEWIRMSQNELFILSHLSSVEKCKELHGIRLGFSSRRKDF